MDWREGVLRNQKGDGYAAAAERGRLKLCQHAIVEETTRNVTLVNCFRKLPFAAFPAEASRFFVCAVLTDGQGDGKLRVTIMSLEDGDDVWTRSWDVTFLDPLAERWFLLPVDDCTFPQAGKYEVGLTIDGEPAARTILQILST